MSTFNLGRILPKFVGSWTAGTTYQPLDIVLYGGSSWVAKQTTSGLIPASPLTENADWLLVSAGAMLSGNLTQDQINAVITQLQSRGVVIDTGYVPANDGQLSVVINNNTACTFTANQAGNSTLRFTIPSRVAQLEDSANYVTINDQYTHEETDVTIGDLKPNALHVCISPISHLTVGNYGIIDSADPTTWIYPESYIIFDSATGGAEITFPIHTYFCGSDAGDIADGHISGGHKYMFKFKGSACEILRLS